MRRTDRAAIANIGLPGRVMAPMRYYGGKGNLAKKILPLLPTGKFYVEAYCGAASMFFHRPQPWGVEVLNDLDGNVVNLFRVLQDEELFREFAHRVIWTPYSRAEFARALEVGDDAPPLDRAWAFYMRQNQGFGGEAKTIGQWGRAFESTAGMAENANKWRKRMAMLPVWHDRLTRVQLDNRDALEVIEYWDSPETVFYLDPPYAPEVRVPGSRNVYKKEADKPHHERLVGLLLALKGQVMLSGYDTPLYAPLEEAGWERHDFDTACHAAGKVRGSRLQGKGNALKHAARTETVWIRRHDETGRLF